MACSYSFRLTSSFVFICTALFCGTYLAAHAQATPQTSEALQNQIDDSNAQIAQLKAEITKLQSDLNITSKQKATLQSAVTTLTLTIKKTTTSILLTNAQIVQKDREIKKLAGSISTTTSEIGNVKVEVGHTLQELQRNDSEPLLVVFLSDTSLSSIFDSVSNLSAVRTQLGEKAKQLNSLRSNLVVSKNTAQGKRNELAILQSNLAQQKESLAIARDAQAQLLQDTKNKESTYQSLIAQKKAQQQKFEQDLLTYEAQLNLKVTKGSLPATGSTPLAWPVDQPMITQYFGNTEFATANAQVYNGRGHNAIDLRATPGTPLKAARGGVVLGTGNTDATCPGASYGKWVFIKHDDGLSTLYAHLSTITAVEGQTVVTGQIIGYSGSTGYATGPHLHFGVYASSGSEIASFPSKSCKGKIYTMPVGDISAYLNPLSYLPPL